MIDRSSLREGGRCVALPESATLLRAAARSGRILEHAGRGAGRGEVQTGFGRLEEAVQSLSAALCGGGAEGEEEEEQQEEEGESRCDAWRLRGDAAPDSGAAEAVPAERRPGTLMRSCVGRQRPEGCITSARSIGVCARAEPPGGIYAIVCRLLTP